MGGGGVEKSFREQREWERCISRVSAAGATCMGGSIDKVAQNSFDALSLAEVRSIFGPPGKF